MKRVLQFTQLPAWSTGSSRAATVWSAAGLVRPTGPPSQGNGNDPGNWTAAIPAWVTPGGIKMVLNIANAADYFVTHARSFNQFVQGDNGAGGVIRLQSGGRLTISIRRVYPERQDQLDDLIWPFHWSHPARNRNSPFQGSMREQLRQLDFRQSRKGLPLPSVREVSLRTGCAEFLPT